MKVWDKLLSGLGINTSPKTRVLYAVTGGAYLGEFFLYMETVEDAYCFLSLPHMHIRIIPIHKFVYAVDNKILDSVDKIPKGVYRVCCAQYRKNKDMH